MTDPDTRGGVSTWLAYLEAEAKAEGLAPGAYVDRLREAARRPVDANQEISALRRELASFRELFRERIQSPLGEWLDADGAARLLGMSKRGVYVEISRNPTGPLARASTRLGRRLRFSRSAIERLLQKPRRVDQMRMRLPSSREKNG